MNFAWVHSPTWLVVVALAAFRLTRLWVEDGLPPLPRFRRWAERKLQLRWDARREGREYDEKFYAYGPDAPLAALFSCYWCSGFWIAVAVVLAACLLPLWLWAVPFTALALSAVTGLLAART